MQFNQFQIEFDTPEFYNINCIKLIKFEKENNFTIYRGMDKKTSEIFNIYEWNINLETNRTFDKQKHEYCLSQV
jgi:hypothetical protein